MKNLKKLSRNELKTLTGGKLPQVWIAETKCGITAITTQDWTPAEADAWRERVETINCPTPTYSGSDVNHQA